MPEEKVVKKRVARPRVVRKKKEVATEGFVASEQVVQVEPEGFVVAQVVESPAEAEENPNAFDEDDSVLLEEYKFVDVRVVPQLSFAALAKIVLGLALLVFPGLVLLAFSFWDFFAPFEMLVGLALLFSGLRILFRNLRRFLS